MPIASLPSGIEIEYESYGEGEPLVLVMGLGAQLVAWPMDFVKQLTERGFRVIRYDNRDIGLSTKFDHVTPPKPGRMLASLISRRFTKAGYLLSDMAGDLAGLLDHLQIARAHIVGASMGGMIAQTFAIEHPNRTLSLCSIMSNTGDRKNGGAKLSTAFKLLRLQTDDPAKVLDNAVTGGRLIAGPHFDPVAARDLAREAIARHHDPAGVARQMAAISASPDRTEALGHVGVPTLVIHGLVDTLVKPSGGIATAKAVPNSRLLTFPDMAHDLPRNRWPEIVDAIVENTERAG